MTLIGGCDQDKMTIGRAITIAAELLPDEQDERNLAKIKNTILALCGRIQKQDLMIEHLEAQVEALEEIEHGLRTKHGAVERR